MAAGSLWLLAYRSMPLGRSPMGRAIGALVGLTLAWDLVTISGVANLDPKQSRIMVHGMGAAVGAGYFFLYLRKPAARAAVLKNAQLAASLRFQSKAASTKTASFAAATAATKQNTTTAAAAAAAASSSPHAVVPVADDSSSSAPATLSDTPKRPALPKINDTPSPANADMRPTPPKVTQKKRFYSTSAIAKRWTTCKPMITIRQQPRMSK